MKLEISYQMFIQSIVVIFHLKYECRSQYALFYTIDFIVVTTSHFLCLLKCTKKRTKAKDSSEIANERQLYIKLHISCSKMVWSQKFFSYCTVNIRAWFNLVWFRKSDKNILIFTVILGSSHNDENTLEKIVQRIPAWWCERSRRVFLRWATSKGDINSRTKWENSRTYAEKLSFSFSLSLENVTVGFIVI